jgi:hypothetical protein
MLILTRRNKKKTLILLLTPYLIGLTQRWKTKGKILPSSKNVINVRKDNAFGQCILADVWLTFPKLGRIIEGIRNYSQAIFWAPHVKLRTVYNPASPITQSPGKALIDPALIASTHRPALNRPAKHSIALHSTHRPALNRSAQHSIARQNTQSPCTALIAQHSIARHSTQSLGKALIVQHSIAQHCKQ